MRGSYYSFYLKKFILANDNEFTTQTTQPKLTPQIAFFPLSKVLSTKLDISEFTTNDEKHELLVYKSVEFFRLQSPSEYHFIFKRLTPTSYEAMLIDIAYFENNFPFSHKKDIILTTPVLALSALYQAKSIEKIGVDCFIVFGEHESFLAIYKNGQYHFSIPLDITFANLLNRYYSEYGYDELIRLVESKEITLDERFGDILSKMVVQINHIKHQLLIDDFSHIYLWSDKVYGLDLKPIATEHFKQPVNHLEFDASLHDIRDLYTKLAFTAIVKNKSILLDNFIPQNIYAKIKKIFVANLAVSFGLVVAFALFELYVALGHLYTINQKTMSEDSLNKDVIEFINKVKTKQNQIEQIDTNIRVEHQKQNTQQSRLATLQTQVNAPHTLETLATLTQNLNYSSVYLKQILVNNNHDKQTINLALLTKNELNLSRFLKKVELESKQITIKDISKTDALINANIEITL